MAAPDVEGPGVEEAMSSRRGHGEGSIYRRADGRWVGSVDLGFREGKRVRRHFFGATRKDVADLVGLATQAHRAGTLAPGKPPSVAQFLVMWLDAITVEASTYRGYEWLVRVHLIPELGRIRLDRLAALDVDRMLREKARDGLSPQTCVNLRAALRGAMSFATRKGLVAQNVVKLSEPIKTQTYEALYLTLPQARELLVAARHDRLGAVYCVAIPLGLRQGEILGLRWSDVDFDANRLHVRTQAQRVQRQGIVLKEPKWHSNRTVALPELTARALRAHKLQQAAERLRAGNRWVDQDLVFTTRIGTPISASNLVNRSFKPLLERSGLPPRLRFQDLRHSAATLLLAQGVPLRVVSAMLGHSTMRVTERYAAVVPELHLAAAAAMDRALGS